VTLRAGSEHVLIEYRICWSASSNISFRGESDWIEANAGETVVEVEDALNRGGGGLGEGFEMALELSGFEWWIETREAGDES
jgi:hypothetical protein